MALKGLYAWVGASSKTLKTNENEEQSFRKYSTSQSTAKGAMTCDYTQPVSTTALLTDHWGHQDPLSWLSIYNHQKRSMPEMGPARFTFYGSGK